MVGEPARACQRARHGPAILAAVRALPPSPRSLIVPSLWLSVGLSLWLLLWPASLAAQPAPRFAARLRLVAAGALPPSALGSPPAVSASAALPTVMVRVSGGAARLSALGFAAAPAGRELAFVQAGRAELVALHALAGVASVERCQPLRPTLDRSVPLTGATTARTVLGRDGRGVLIGIVDTGIDFRHPDFRDQAGHTRVAALLDLGSRRGALHPELPDFGKGALWLAEDLDAQLAAEAAHRPPAQPVGEADVDGHGTHVAGIAASGGLATARGLPAGRYRGMAPAARLVVAKAARDGHSFAESDVLAGLRFAFDTASRAGLPLVANLSVGGDSGPHDGTTAFEQAIAELAPESTPGRVVVVSAGNAGSRDRHAGGFRLDGGVRLRVPFPAGAPADEALSIELWFDGPPPALTLVSPSGRSFGPVAAGGLLDQSAGAEGQVRIDASTAPDPQNQRWDAAVIVSGAGGSPVGTGTWELWLRGATGRWDAWITDADTATEPRFLDQLDPDVRADFPAYAPSVISAGSYVSRAGWTTASGEQVARGTVVGAPSTFSGTGPSASGRFFPDVAAPGDFILSALSADAPPGSPDSAFNVPGDPGYLVADDGLHGALRGTSQAAPHVAGAIALLLQEDPTLSAHAVRELLRTAAALGPGDPGYSVRSGFGRLDVAAALALLRRSPVGGLDAARSSVGVSRDAVPPGARLTVTVVPRDGSGAPLGPAHSAAIGCDGCAFDGPEQAMGAGRWERTLVASAPLGSLLTVGATVDGVALSARPAVWVVAARSDVGHPFVAVGSAPLGCALGPARRPAAQAPLPLALPFLGLLASWLRRHRARREAGQTWLRSMSSLGDGSR